MPAIIVTKGNPIVNTRDLPIGHVGRIRNSDLYVLKCEEFVLALPRWNKAFDILKHNEVVEDLGPLTIED